MQYGGKRALARPSHTAYVMQVLVLLQYMNFDYVSKMVYSKDDVGPFYLSSEEREKQKYNPKTGDIKRKDKTIAKLREELTKLGVQAKGKKDRVVELAKAAKIDLKKSYEEVIPGWVGKAKGMLQVSFERG